MDAQGTLEELEGLLDGIGLADARWCRARLKDARRRLKSGKPADRILQQVLEQATASAQRVQARRQRLPAPGCTCTLPAHRIGIAPGPLTSSCSRCDRNYADSVSECTTVQL